MYTVHFDSEAIDFLEKSGKGLAKRIWNKILSAKENPHRSFARLTGRKDYKLRIGDYRVIADIDDSKKVIEISLIGHRKSVYKQI